MTLSDAQLGRIVAHALPGARLVEAEPMGGRTLRLELRGRRPAVLRLAAPADRWAGDPLAAEAAALIAMRAEIDLPLPELLAHDLDGAAGAPFLLLSYLEGTSLVEALPALGHEQRYELGRALGAVMARVHAYAAAAYGPLDPAAPPALPDEEPRGPADEEDETGLVPASGADVAYLRRRILDGVDAALAARELDPAGAERIATWLEGNLAGTGRPAALVNGDLRPERVLVRRRERGWSIAGLSGWGFAQAWRPAWDHAALAEQFAGDDYFDLRVGYGNAYDATTERRYDQTREFALVPFRLALFLEAGRPGLGLGLVGTPGAEGQ